MGDAPSPCCPQVHRTVLTIQLKGSVRSGDEVERTRKRCAKIEIRREVCTVKVPTCSTCLAVSWGRKNGWRDRGNACARVCSTPTNDATPLEVPCSFFTLSRGLPDRHFPHIQEQVLKVLSSEKNGACTTCRGVQRGDLLEIEYTGTLENGSVFDGSSITVSSGIECPQHVY